MPVLLGASRAQITSVTIANASFWKDIIIMKLIVNMPLLTQSDLMSPEEQQYTFNFAEWLIQLSDGTLNENMEMSLPDGTLLMIHLN